jgi:hypothetical protein
MPINRFNRYFDQHINRHLLFIIILVVHIAMILGWKDKHSHFKHTTNTDKTLLLLALPLQKPSIKITKQKAIQGIKPKLTIQLANKKSISKPEAVTATNQNQTLASESEIQTAQLPIQKNIRDLSQSLKDDFLKQEKNFRPDSKSSGENMKKFSNALADAAQIQREGVIIEKKFAYDGRPVSKVKTPYGTYCIRHPKAGEKLELSPPPLPVTCGQL